jgi:hypothetical protein
VQTLFVLPDDYTLWQVPAGATPPTIAAARPSILSITTTGDEVSVVSTPDLVPAGVTAAEHGWTALGVRGPLDLSLTGVLASIAGPLADAAVSIFAISTFDTDYVLVKSVDLERAVQTLEASGHRVERRAAM